jgi:two-component system sensor histidine kinase HydH
MGGTRSALTLSFARLCLDFFAWNFASLAYDLSGGAGWFYLERSTSPFSAPLAFHLLLTFTGKLREKRILVIVAYAAFAAISIPALLSFGVESARAFATSRAWAAAHLTGVVVTMAYAGWLLFLQLRTAFAPAERASTGLVLLALGVGSILTSTELVADLGIAVPRLGHVGTLCASLLMGMAVLKFRLIDAEVSWVVGLRACIIGVIALGAHLAVFALHSGNTAMALWGTTTVTLAAILSTRASVARASERRQRLEYLATLGRFSAQMAHDLKNPLAALKGAVQFLMTERGAGKGIEQQDEFMELLAEQIDRMDRIVDQYQRLGRVEPIVRRAQINGVVRSVLALHTVAALNRVKICTELRDGLPECGLDQDLLAGALENLLRNAAEAMPRGGTVTVRTSLSIGTGRSFIVLAVEDTGEGMDVRVQERAFDDFFTTKASGSGLGLAFVRRVADAHGATIGLSSALGRGTSIELKLPVHCEARPHDH